jgi:hypothetical protein
MTKKPTPNLENFHAIAESLRDDPAASFIFALQWRARTLLEDSGLPPTAITFEMIQSVLSAFAGGLAHSDIAEGYPVAAWREDTVEIPRAWLQELVVGWQKYKSGPVGSTFGESFGIDGRGQGKQPVRAKLRQLNKELRLSNEAIVEYLAERAEGGQGSWERAYGKVAASEGVSEDTVKRACEKRLEAAFSRAEYLGLIASP